MGFPTNINSEPKIAVFREKQPGIGLEKEKVCAVQEGKRKRLGEVVSPLSLCMRITHQGDVFLCLQIFIALDGLIY